MVRGGAALASALVMVMMVPAGSACSCSVTLAEPFAGAPPSKDLAQVALGNLSSDGRNATDPSPRDIPQSLPASAPPGHVVNSTLVVLEDAAFDVYGEVVRQWPRNIPVPAFELLGVSFGPVPLAGPPDIGGATQVRPSPTAIPSPPSEKEFRELIRGRDENTPSLGWPLQEDTAGHRGGSDQGPQRTPAHGAESLVHRPSPAADAEDPQPVPASATPLTTGVDARGLSTGHLTVFIAFAISLASLGAWLVAQPRILRRLLPLPLVGLFSRQAGRDVLTHPSRKRVHAAVSQNPGITAATLADVTALAPSSLRYHITVLQREGLIRVTRRGKVYHYHEATGKITPHARARECLFWRRRTSLASAILENPGATQKTVASLAGLPPSRVCTYTRELAGAGLIESTRSGRSRRYFPTPLLRSLHAEGQIPSD